MTRKDFEIVAEIIAKTRQNAEDWEIDAILRQTNPNYNPARFWRAVEKYGEK